MALAVAVMDSHFAALRKKTEVECFIVGGERGREIHKLLNLTDLDIFYFFLIRDILY